MSAVIETSGLGKQYRRTWALRDCTLAIPEGHVVGLVGPNGAGKTTLLRLATGMLTPTRGTITVLGQRPAAGAGAAGPGRLRRPGHPRLRPADGRRPSPARRLAQPRLGRRPGAAADRAARPGPEAAGRVAVRRAAGPARPHPGAGQAARAAHPRRAGRQPGPAGPAGVPAGPDGGGRRAGPQRRAVLPSGRRPGTGLRLPDRSRRLPGPGRRGGQRPAGLASPPVRAAPRPARLPAGQEVITESHTDKQSNLLVRTDEPVLDPAWAVKPVSLEDLVLAYMSRAGDETPASPPRLRVAS